MTTFTSHRSPLGLVFDKDSLLSDEFRGHGFLLGWTAGVGDTSTNIGPFADPGQDLLHIQLIYDKAVDNYRIQTHRIAWHFNNPVDAEIVGNIIYVLEYGGPAPKIWKVELPMKETCDDQSYITREQYNNIPGSSVGNLTSNKNYPDHPNTITKLNSFESPLNSGENYGVRVRGYITAPISGKFTFFLAADDAAELWLSTDATTGNKKKIATVSTFTYSRQYNKFINQKSIPINLKAGTKYYMEALQKENNGGDNLSVSWQLPGGLMEVPISCDRLSPYIISTANFTFSDTVNTLKKTIPLYAIVLFPNPAHDYVNVKFTATKTSSGNVEISNIAGLSVYKTAVMVIEGVNTLNIKTSELSRGTYTLKLSYYNLIYTSKIILE